MLSDKASNAVIGLVSVVWAVNFTAGLFVQQYEPSETINAIFMAIVGGVFALKGRNTPPSGEGKP